MWVADLCAAPGGKTSQLAAALQGQGLLVANEFVAARAEILRQNLERMGVTNALVTNEDTARLAAAWPGRFDRVLVDAPCSGEGMFRKEPAALAQHDAALVAHCAELGAQILENAAALLAPGGILVYSTCTFAPEEDEGQIHPHSENYFTSNGYIFCIQQRLKKEWFAEGTPLPIQDHMFNAPKQYKEYLTFFYGDYMRLPPEDKRYPEHVLD